MRIMTFLAHPDDAEIGCAGTLALYRRAGHTVTIAFACTGDKGNYTTPPAALAAVRGREAATAAALLQAEVVCLGIGDAELMYDQPTLGLVTDAIRAARPDIIFTHTPEDYHLDHKTISRLVVDASFIASVPHVRPATAAIGRLPQIYFVEPYSGIGFAPGEYVDITSTLETKLDMMGRHQSQITWMREHDGLDVLDYIRTTAKYRGYQCGVPYAECFTRYVAALRAAPGNFLPQGEMENTYE